MVYELLLYNIVNMVVSSAKLQTFVSWGKKNQIIFIKMLNRISPRIEFCGIPLKTSR